MSARYGVDWAWAQVRDRFWSDNSMRIGPVVRGYEPTGGEIRALEVLRDEGWAYDCMDWAVDLGEPRRRRASSAADLVLNR